MVFENPTPGVPPIHFFKVGNRIFIDNFSGWYSSADQGQTWTAVSMNGAQTVNGFFPRVTAHTDNVNFATLYGSGVFRSDDLGENWEPYNTGLEGLRTFEIFYSNDYLYFGSFANGVWRREVEEEMVSTKEEFIDSQFLQISPNPTTGHAYLALNVEGLGFGKLEIYNIQGQLLRQQNLNIGIAPQKINLEGVLPGFYTLKYSVDGKFYIGKLIVQ